MVGTKQYSGSRNNINAARIIRAALIIAIIGFSVGILFFAMIGFHSRYLADDYCYSTSATDLGFFNGFWTTYTTWSGRYSAILFLQGFGYLGRYFPAILPSLILAGFCFSLFWLYQGVQKLALIKVSRLVSWNLALGTVFFLYWLMPNRYQVLFWMNGSVSYSFPLILLITAIAWIVDLTNQNDSHSKKWKMIPIGFLLLIGSGFSETNAVFQVSLLGVLWIWSLLISPRKNLMELRKFFFVSLVISTIGMLLVIVAPGNSVRQVFFPPPPGFVNLIKLSAQFGLDFIKDTLRSSPLPIAIIVLWAVVFTIIQNRAQEKSSIEISKKIIFIFIGIFATALLLAIAICTPSVYAETAYPEARALSSGIFMLVICILILGVLTGCLLTKLISHFSNRIGVRLLFISSFMLCLISIYPIRASVSLIPDLQQVSRFSSRWDNRFNEIQQLIIAGETSISVNAIDSQYGIQEISQDPSNWVNTCVSRYFGLESITAH